VSRRAAISLGHRILEGRWDDLQLARTGRQALNLPVLCQLHRSGVEKMMDERRIETLWRRTVVHLLFVVLVGTAIIGYYLVRRVWTSSGPTFAELALAFAALLVWSAIVYFASRLVKSAISSWSRK